MLFDGFFVFILPLSLGYNDVSGSFFLEDLSLLFSSDDVQEWNVESLASLVEHPSESRGSSSMDDSFFSLSVLVDVGHTYDSQWVNNS